MAKKLMIVTAFRKKFQIFLFHLKAALFKPFHYLYGIFIPRCYSYFEIFSKVSILFLKKLEIDFKATRYKPIQPIIKPLVIENFLQQEVFGIFSTHHLIFWTTKNITVPYTFYFFIIAS